MRITWIAFTFSCAAIACSDLSFDDTDGEVLAQEKTVGYRCPEGARFATNGEDRMFCLFENLPVPAAHQVEEYCHYLHRGYMGYHWPLCEDTSASPCGPQARYTTNQQDLSFCIYDLDPLPVGANSYCQHLDEGYIGFSWSLCPPGAKFVTNKDGLHFCVFEDLALPEGTTVTPECDHLREGYIGFSFPLCNTIADYTCPQGFSYWTDGKKTGKCYRQDFTVPMDVDVNEYCWRLQEGYFGFLWQDPR